MHLLAEYENYIKSAFNNGITKKATNSKYSYFVIHIQMNFIF